MSDFRTQAELKEHLESVRKCYHSFDYQYERKLVDSGAHQHLIPMSTCVCGAAEAFFVKTLPTCKWVRMCERCFVEECIKEHRAFIYLVETKWGGIDVFMKIVEEEELAKMVAVGQSLVFGPN